MGRKSSNRFFECFRPECPLEAEGHETSDGKRSQGLRQLAKAVLFVVFVVKKILGKISKHKYYRSNHNFSLPEHKKAPHSSNLSQTDLKTDSNYSSAYVSSKKSASFTTSLTPFCSSSGSPLISTTSFDRKEDFEFEKPNQLSSQMILTRRIRGRNLAICLFVV